MSQPDVASLAQHWVHRFVQNGVPLDDYFETTRRIEDWDGWCAAWAQTGEGRLVEAERAEAEGADLTAAELRLAATMEFHFGKYLFVHDMAQLKAVHERAVSSYRQALPDLPWPGELVSITFGELALPGVLRVPAETPPYPAVVVVPGLDATKEEVHRFCDVFLARGMATLALDGPGQGEMEYDLPLRPDWEVVGRAAVDMVAADPRIDAGRLAMVGVSLGGYFAARTASVAPRLRAAASVGGCYSFGACWQQLPLLTRRAFQVRAGAASDDEARKLADTFTMAGAQPQAGTPFLVMHGGRDRLFDNAQAENLAEHFGPDGTLVVEPQGNHVLHNLAYRVRPVVADWVRRRLDEGRW